MNVYIVIFKCATNAEPLSDFMFSLLDKISVNIKCSLNLSCSRLIHSCCFSATGVVSPNPHTVSERNTTVYMQIALFIDSEIVLKQVIAVPEHPHDPLYSRREKMKKFMCIKC